MLINVGDRNEMILTRDDYFDIIERKISDEFVREFRNEMYEWEIEIEGKYQEIYDREIEGVDDSVKGIAQGIRDYLEELVRPLDQGKRINRREVIDGLKSAIKMLEELTNGD